MIPSNTVHLCGDNMDLEWESRDTMTDEPVRQTNGQMGPQTHDVLTRLNDVVLDGLHHGFFRCTITSAIGKGRKREVIIEAGKLHKFTIPEDEFPADPA